MRTAMLLSLTVLLLVSTAVSSTTDDNLIVPACGSGNGR